MTSTKRLSRTSKAVERRASTEDINRILDEINPLEAERGECQGAVLSAVSMITEITTSVPPGKLKKQLDDVATALRKARTAMMNLRVDWRHLLLVTLDDGFARPGAERYMSELDRIIAKCEDQAAKINIKDSGGAEAARKIALRKEVAAAAAFQLLIVWGEHFPTKTKGGPYFTLARQLFEMATGNFGDCDRACRNYLTLTEGALTKQRWHQLHRRKREARLTTAEK
jgi:hypothetical protein